MILSLGVSRGIMLCCAVKERLPRLAQNYHHGPFKSKEFSPAGDRKEVRDLKHEESIIVFWLEDGRDT